MELKDVHKALEQAAIFKTVFDAFPHGIVIATPDGIIRFTNNAFQQLSGVDASCAISKSVDEFFQCSTTDEPPVSRLFREAGCQRIELANRFIRTGDKKIRVNLTVTDMDPVVCYTVIKVPHLTEVPARYDDLKNLYVALADKNEQLSQA
ncbi:MAG: PAS domain-containing protein, partial [Chitinophagaceae bacterium]